MEKSGAKAGGPGYTQITYQLQRPTLIFNQSINHSINQLFIQSGLSLAWRSEARGMPSLQSKRKKKDTHQPAAPHTHQPPAALILPALLAGCSDDRRAPPAGLPLLVCHWFGVLAPQIAQIAQFKARSYSRISIGLWILRSERIKLSLAGNLIYSRSSFKQNKLQLGLKLGSHFA